MVAKLDDIKNVSGIEMQIKFYEIPVLKTHLLPR